MCISVRKFIGKKNAQTFKDGSDGNVMLVGAINGLKMTLLYMTLL